MKENAAQICNTAIRSRHATTAKFLDAKIAKGWLVPTSTKLLAKETAYIDEIQGVGYSGD